MSAPQDVRLSNLPDFPLPALSGARDKEARGRVLVVAGGRECLGAAVLTGIATLRAGAGKLRLAATEAAALGLGLAVPEAAVTAVEATAAGEIAQGAAAQLAEAVRHADSVVVGPGMMDETAAGRLALGLMEASTGAAFVLDAAAMTGVDLTSGSVDHLAGRLVLTPHAGEMARLTGKTKSAVEANPLVAARSIAKTSRGVVIMKWAESFIVSPDGRAWRHRGGVIGLATSGSGDVLAGVIGGLLARGASPLVASVWAVCVHAAAGLRLSERIGPVGFLARELLDEIPNVMADAARDDCSSEAVG